MKTLLRLSLLLLMWLAVARPDARAQAEGTAFSCDGTFYQVRQIGTGAAAFSALYLVDRSTSTYSTSIFTFGGTKSNGSLGVVVNALGYNPQDSYLYAITYPADNNLALLNAATGIHLFRIGKGGIQDLGKTDLPLARYNSGTIDKQGNMYLNTRDAVGNFTNTLFRLKLSNFSTVLTSHEELPLVLPNGNPATEKFADFALNPNDNKLYGSSALNDLFSIEIQPTQAVQTTVARPNNSTQIIGSNFFDVAGNLYGYDNNGGIYTISTTTGASTLIGTVDKASNSDGASCINPSERIDVVKEFTGLAITENGLADDNRQTFYDISFAVRVKNTGTSTATNVQVTDFLDNTFGATAFTIQTAPAVTNFNINGGAFPTLAPNPAFDGKGTNANLLTSNQALTAGQSALLTFTVRLTFNGTPAPIPNTVFNNSAYASTTSGTGNRGHIKLSNGTIIPPGNLLAQDQSTNSGAFPVTPNGDTPSPTPVRLRAAIQGTVFEDVNYGGGAGRNQPASNGQGTSARVELYSVTTSAGVDTYTYLNTTNTDANGNYIFTATTGTTALAANTTYGIRVVNSSVRSTRPGANNNLVSVQTFRTDGTTATLAEVTDRVGGEQPNKIDYDSISSGTLAAPAASTTQEIQSISKVLTPASGPRVGIDFGFNFSTIVNINDTGQGSLRQFITNSNALKNGGLDQAAFNGTVASGTTGFDPAPGVETSIFMLSDGRAVAGLRSGLTPATGYSATAGFVFTPASALPAITDSNTALDGNKQANLTGKKVAAVSESTTGPEITLNFNNQKGLFVTGSNTVIRAVGLNNAKGSIGTTPTSDITYSDGAGVTFSGAGASGSTVTLVTTRGNARTGVRLEQSVEDVKVINNILNDNTGVDNAQNGDGLQLLGTVNATVTDNVINGNKGNGIFLTTAANTGATIANNIIRKNGSGKADGGIAGINIVQGTNTVVLGNTISGNAGDGILAMNNTATNRFSQNSIFGNVDQGIDLSGVGAKNNGDGATKNAGTKPAGANGMLNFPVITQASTTTTGTANNNLRISGYAPTGSTIEFFLSDKTADGFGQGKTYLFTRVEGSTINGEADADTKTGNYSGTINGLDQGSETGASRFYFNIPISSLSSTLQTAITAGTARITATATVGRNTSEFSGNILVKQNSPLPVTLVSFGTQATGLNAQLNWKTAQELNNDHFVVERSFDGRGFVVVGEVKGQGSTQVNTTYAFTDARVAALAPAGLIYYRLRQVDTDGTASLSEIQTVFFSLTARGPLEVYPNPATVIQDAKLDLSGAPTGSYQVTLVDMTGRTLRSFTQNGGTVQELQLTSLPTGTYLVRVQGNGQSFSRRVIKQ